MLTKKTFKRKKKMDTLNLSDDQIILRATSLVERFKQLHEFAEANGIVLPEEYDATREGGYLGLHDSKRDVSHFLQAGQILKMKDPEYDWKETKYLVFAKKKILALLDEEFGRVFKTLGRLKIDKRYCISFSGRSPHEDEALVILLAYQCAWIDYEKFKEIQEEIKNPYLGGKICDFLLAA